MTVLYIASYGKDDNRGIYIVNLDKANNTLAKVQQIVTPDFPSYMITKGNILYTAYKMYQKNRDGGGIGIFGIHQDELIPIQNFSSNGRSYTHICVSDNDRYLFVANYHVGATASYAMENHKITQKIMAVHHTGLGPDILKRQTAPHAHYVGFTPDKKYLYSVDLGADKIVMYNYAQGQLVEDPDHTLNVLPGSGPRHMIFSQDGRYAYLVNEISNQLMVFAYKDGYFTMLQAIRTVPRHFKDFSAAAAIRMTKSGKHLLISNRGHDSLALYRVNQTSGKVTLLYMVHTGKGPRDFNIIDDKYIVVACQEDNELELFIFDETSESLVRTTTTLGIPQPVCIAY